MKILWNYSNRVSKGDYYYAIVPDHPNKTVNNYVLEHRVVMENHLGRLLESGEVVHHINEDKKDNRVENLQLLTASEHTKLHGLEKGQSMVTLKCPSCSSTFDREKRQTHLAKNGRFTCCSTSCRGKFSRMIQLNNPEIQERINNNVIGYYNSLQIAPVS